MCCEFKTSILLLLFSPLSFQVAGVFTGELLLTSISPLLFKTLIEKEEKPLVSFVIYVGAKVYHKTSTIK